MLSKKIIRFVRSPLIFGEQSIFVFMYTDEVNEFIAAIDTRLIIK